MAILIIYYLGFFFPSVRTCCRASLGHQYMVKEYNPRWCKGYHFPWQPVSCVLQDPSCLPVNIQIQLKGSLSLEAWSCLKLRKERHSFCTLLPELCSVEALELLWKACSMKGPWQWKKFPSLVQSSWDYDLLSVCKAHCASTHADGRGFLMWWLLCFVWEDLHPFGSWDMLLFYFCFDNWNQGQPGIFVVLEKSK